MTEKEVKKSSKPTVTQVRTAVLIVAFVGIAVGLAFHIGWGTLSSMGIGAIAAICPLGALETFVASKTLIPRMVIALIAVVVIAILVGRMFCSWICPVPPLSKFFRPSKKDKAGEKNAEKTAENGASGTVAAPLTAEEQATLKAATVHHHEEGCSSEKGHHCGACGSLSPVGGKRDGRKIDSRHWVLGGSLVSAAIFGFPVFCLICPIGLVFATAIAVVRAVGYQEPTWSLLIFPAILIVELVVLRKWCHKFCPMGALLSLLNWGNNKIRPKVNEEVCLRSAKGTDCQVCVNVCPEGLDPHSKHIPECTKCGLCVDACPSKAISLLGRSKKPVLAGSEVAVKKPAFVGSESAAKATAPDLGDDADLVLD